MNESNRSIFEKWAPAGGAWSDWAKPTLFISPAIMIPAELPELPAYAWPYAKDGTWAIIVDLPGEESVLAGLALAKSGFRPAPLFNGCDGPSPAVDTAPVIRMLRAGADFYALRQLPEDAPPAFLLDSRRKGTATPILSGVFDNRWICLPQDFPSAALLKDHGIQNIAAVCREAKLPAEDLLHILRRWQEGGLRIHQWILGENSSIQPMVVPRPKHFRSLWYAILARMGFRSNWAGGFGSVIPQPSQG